MTTKSPSFSVPFTFGDLGDAGAWHELEEVMDDLGQAARSSAEPKEFYAQLVARTVQALAALGGAVWLRDPRGGMRITAQFRLPIQPPVLDDEAGREHLALLARLASDGRNVNTACESTPWLIAEGEAVQLLMGTVPVLEVGKREQSESGIVASPPALAVVEIAQPADVSPAVCQGQQRFLAAVCEIAAEYHAFRELGELRTFERHHRQLMDLSRRVHQATGLRHTACELANEGARVIGCDRLSVAIPRGRACRLTATNGVKQLARRSSAVRQLERLAAVALRINEPIYYAGDTSDCLPQVAELLEQYADKSHARQIAILPIALRPEEESSEQTNTRSRSDDRPVAVLIAEQFDAHSDELLERTGEVARLAAPALVQATRWDRLPLRWLLEPAGRARDLLLPRNLAKTVAAVGAVAAIVAALVLVPADFTIEAPGTLQPAVRRHVFASRSGLVDEVLTRHGDMVTQGDELVRLRDPDLDLEWKRISGELETVGQQLDAVRASKSGRAAGDLTALEGYRLSAEQRQLEQQLKNLRHELDLLNAERESLVLRSPLTGRVITWDVDRLLTARPVDRGQVLLTVADLDAQWQLELDVADDRIGHVLAARSAGEDALPVQFRLSSNERDQFEGRVAAVAGLAESSDEVDTSHAPTVRVTVSFDKQPLIDATAGELRPGLTARASIDCGQRALGYVWLHDIWDALVRWFTF